MFFDFLCGRTKICSQLGIAGVKQTNRNVFGGRMWVIAESNSIEERGTLDITLCASGRRTHPLIMEYRCLERLWSMVGGLQPLRSLLFDKR